VHPFTVVDLTPQCEIRACVRYSYDLLERIEGAPDLIGRLSSAIWATPDGFDLALGPTRGILLKWRPTSESTGIATIRSGDQTLSVSIICSGVDASADQSTLQAFQSHIFRQLHTTSFEASFELLGVPDRPLLATLSLFPPPAEQDRGVFALADRCLAAAYFRRSGLA
jgi:hypothetical protein